MIVANCESCRFWSDLLAKADAKNPGDMLALCLNATSPQYQKWTRTRDVCPKQQIGEPTDARKFGRR